MNWSEAIEAQDELRHFWRSPIGRSFGREWHHGRPDLKMSRASSIPIPWTADATASEPSNVRGLPRPDDSVDIGESQRELLDHADLYWVAPQMVDLIEAAAPRMPDQIFHREDLPCERGFVVYARPIVYPDIRGKKVNISAMSWRPVVDTGCHDGSHGPRSGVLVAHYSDTTAHDDYLSETSKEMASIGRTLPRLFLLHVEVFVFDAPLIPPDFNLAPPEGRAFEELLATLRIQRKGPLCFWTLCQQPLAVVERKPAERATRRRLEKSGSPLDVSAIRVVELRRVVHKATTEPGAEPVEWSHRWIVSGHWRNQWLPSQGRHRLQWIHSFVKGPDDKPLIVKKTVHALVR